MNWQYCGVMLDMRKELTTALVERLMSPFGVMWPWSKIGSL